MQVIQNVTYISLLVCKMTTPGALLPSDIPFISLQKDTNNLTAEDKDKQC